MQTQKQSRVIKMNFQVTYRRDPSAVAFATSVGKAQPQTEYKVHLTNLSKQAFPLPIIALDVGISMLRIQFEGMRRQH